MIKNLLVNGGIRYNQFVGGGYKYGGREYWIFGLKTEENFRAQTEMVMKNKVWFSNLGD